MVGNVDRLKKIFQNEEFNKPTKTQKKASVFKNRDVNLPKSATKHARLYNNQPQSELNTRNKIVDHNVKKVNNLIKMYENKAPNKPTAIQQKASVFKNRAVDLQKSATKHARLYNNQQQSKLNTRNKIADHDAKTVNNLIKKYENKAPNKPTAIQQKASVFKNRAVDLQKSATKHARLYNNQQQSKLNTRNKIADHDAKTVNNLIKKYENKAPNKPTEIQQRASVFKNKWTNSQKNDTKYAHTYNNQQKSKANTRNKAVDYDIGNVAGLNKGFKDKLEAALSTKPKKTGMISTKRSQEAISNKQHLQMEEQDTNKQQDLAIQHTTTSASASAPTGLLNVPPPPAPPPPLPKAINRPDTSLKDNIRYKIANRRNPIEPSKQEVPIRGTKTTTPKTPENQAVMDELHKKIKERMNKSSKGK